jgi:hypothetical protein
MNYTIAIITTNSDHTTRGVKCDLIIIRTTKQNSLTIRRSDYSNTISTTCWTNNIIYKRYRCGDIEIGVPWHATLITNDDVTNHIATVNGISIWTTDDDTCTLLSPKQDKSRIRQCWVGVAEVYQSWIQSHKCQTIVTTHWHGIHP